jgi:AraC-like DNA-binding protein
LPFSKTTPVLQLSTVEFPLIRQLIDNINAEYNARQTGYEAIIQAHMQALMLHLQRTYRKQHPEQDEKSTKPELVNRFMQLIQLHYIDHYNVVQYAEKLHISSKHLIELCKTHTGQTPLQHIRAYTISEAKKLLYHTPSSVKEIAYQLHFDDPANFSKYFKSATGYTPQEYREGIR